MANQAWPSQLPPITVDTLSEALPDQTLRTSMDVGIAKLRRRTTTNIRPVRGDIKLSQEQSALLDTFYVDTLKGGTLPFDMADPRTGASVTFRFTEPPAIRASSPRTGPTGGRYTATIALERVPSAPEDTCYIFDGTEGTHEFCESSTVTLRLVSGRVTAAGVDQTSVPVDRLLTFEAITGTANDPESIKWSYTNADGTSWAVFHRDDGWSYSPDGDHVFSPGGIGGTIIKPSAADETDAPLFRHKGEAAPAGDELCSPDNTLGAFVMADATVAEGTGPIPAARASGFRHWHSVCGVAVSCHTLTGTLGSFHYCEDSTVELEYISGRFIDTDADTQHDAADITFPLIQVATFASVSGTTSMTWSFVDGDGTSSVTFHASNGWSYNIDGDHPPATGATGTDIPVIAATNSELVGDLDLFRHYGRTLFTDADADAKCPIPGGAPPVYPTFGDKEAAEVDEATEVSGTLGGISVTGNPRSTRLSIDTDTVGGPAQPPTGGGGSEDAVAWWIKIRATVGTGSSQQQVPLRGLGFVDIAILCEDGSYSD